MRRNPIYTLLTLVGFCFVFVVGATEVWKLLLPLVNSEGALSFASFIGFLFYFRLVIPVAFWLGGSDMWDFWCNPPIAFR